MNVLANILPFAVFWLFAIPAYASIVLQCIGLYVLMKRRNMKSPWLGAIPLVNMYALGLMVDNIQYYRGRRTTYRYWMLANLIAFPAIMVFTTVTTVWSAAGYDREFLTPVLLIFMVLMIGALVVAYTAMVLAYVCFYRIFQEYAPRDATFFTCMAIFFGLGGAMAFAIRKRVPAAAQGMGSFYAPPPAPPTGRMF